ncbi:MAG: hypothetical protein ACYSW8_31640 [Planctomycetota bacterium]|jgi:hypothetical protein
MNDEEKEELRGRPTKKTPEIEALIFKSLRLGISYVKTASFAGIHVSTLHRWRTEDPVFHDRCNQEVGKATVYVAGKLMQLINSGNFPAIQFWLKTRTDEFREKALKEAVSEPSVDDDEFL